MGNLFDIPKSVGAAQSRFAILGKPFLRCSFNPGIRHRQCFTISFEHHGCDRHYIRSGLSPQPPLRGCVWGVYGGAGLTGGGALIWGGTCDRFRLEDSQRTPFGTVLLYERNHPSVHNRKRIAGSSFTSSSRQCLYLLWLSATVNNLEGGFPISVL